MQQQKGALGWRHSLRCRKVLKKSGSKQIPAPGVLADGAGNNNGTVNDQVMNNQHVNTNYTRAESIRIGLLIYCTDCITMYPYFRYSIAPNIVQTGLFKSHA